MQNPDKIVGAASDDPELGRSVVESDTELDSRPNSIVDVVPSARINSLVAAFAASSILEAVRVDISQEISASTGAADEVGLLPTYERAGWWEQFTILSGRSFKNLYRDPMLMLSHYVVSVVVACESFRRRGARSTNADVESRYLRIFVSESDVSHGETRRRRATATSDGTDDDV